MTRAKRLRAQPWLTAPETLQVMGALEACGIMARFVGGCVRDGYLGKPVFDIDIAVDTFPKDVVECLEKKAIKCVPTGIDHGTVTTVINHKSFQITSLRSDIVSDGRHAVVNFIKDWKQDAARRDFTINALYADKDGYILDPCGTGLEDLKKGLVRFIGNPIKRIEEDALRILRFFRFSAHYSKHGVDALGLKACVASVDKLKGLSAERIQYEFWRLCSAYRITSILTEMKNSGVLQALFPFGGDFERGLQGVKALHDLEEVINVEASPLARMVALFHRGNAELLPDRLKFSKKDRHYFSLLNQLGETFSTKPTVFFIKKCLYMHGPYFTQDYILLNASFRLMEVGKVEDMLNKLTLEIKPLFDKARDWKHPQFPLKGSDLVQEGTEPGPEISLYLEKVMDWWIDQDFKPSRDKCLAYFRETLKGA